MLGVYRPKYLEDMLVSCGFVMCLCHVLMSGHVPAGGKQGRCGWRWCLDSLVPEPGPEEERDNSAADDPRSKVAAVIRKLRAP